jgi:hypothetical protein
MFVNGACRVWVGPWKLNWKSWKRLNVGNTDHSPCAEATKMASRSLTILNVRTRMHGLREEGKCRVSYEKKVGKKEFLNLGTVNLENNIGRKQ